MTLMSHVCRIRPLPQAYEIRGKVSAPETVKLIKGWGTGP